MAYPIFKNKHLETALILPGHSNLGKLAFGDKIPKKCIITYQSEAFDYLSKKYKKQAKELKAGGLWGCKKYYTKDFVFVQMLGVGAPHATIVFEELIALGIVEFLNIGIAGGFRTHGFFICEKSIRDEGTSQHYLPHAKYAHPDTQLTKNLEKSFKKLKIKYAKGISWTTDALFRETKAEIKKYKSQGVKTVEMESSALFVVAKIRKVKIASAFFVSDILGESWNNLYNNQPNLVSSNLKKLADVAITCFSDFG